jgi:hypothetical protein
MFALFLHQLAFATIGLAFMSASVYFLGAYLLSADTLFYAALGYIFLYTRFGRDVGNFNAYKTAFLNFDWDKYGRGVGGFVELVAVDVMVFCLLAIAGRNVPLFKVADWIISPVSNFTSIFTVLVPKLMRELGLARLMYDFAASIVDYFVAAGHWLWGVLPIHELLREPFDGARERMVVWGTTLVDRVRRV